MCGIQAPILRRGGAALKRAQIPEASRRRRSRVAQIVSTARLVRGSVSVRRVTCGNPGCCCARGDRHLALYLVQSKEGKTRQLYIPKQLEGRVREAVGNYRELQRLVEDLSEQEWKLLKKRKD
jgi:hypothetical protein